MDPKKRLEVRILYHTAPKALTFLATQQKIYYNEKGPKSQKKEKINSRTIFTEVILTTRNKIRKCMMVIYFFIRIDSKTSKGTEIKAISRKLNG